MLTASRAREFSKAYRITSGRRFRLRSVDPADTGSVRSKKRAEILLQESVALLSDLQEMLYAQDRWSILLIFQAMDAAGKDSTIKNVMSGINPQGCQVSAFKAPSHEEIDHDFLWRSSVRLPERGRIGIFNRSYYEETLVVRVHPEILEAQRIPSTLVTKNIWQERFEDINNYERFLGRNGYVIRKFFLHVSKEEQRRRFLSRLNEPAKNWKFSLADVDEREHWKDYMHAYEDMIRHTSIKTAPWYVVPADNKWFTRLVVISAVIDAMLEIDLHWPKLAVEKQKELAAARVALESE